MLSVITLNENDKWDKIVKSFKDYDVYYLSSYVKAFKLHGDGEPLLFYYEDDICKGINVIFKRDISDDVNFKDLDKNKYFDFSTPYGYGGWLIEGKNFDNLFNEYELWCKENNIISEFVRFHPVLKNAIYSRSYYEVIALGNTITIDTSNKEEIWNNLSSKNRNVIRKAIKTGIVIENDLNIDLLKTFKDIYNKTMDKDNADTYYYFNDDFYKSINDDLKDNAKVFYAKLNDKIIAASIMIFANNRMNYHLSGSLKEFQHLAPSNLLLYEASLWASENGYKTFYLGGGVGSGEDSLFKFKRAFYKGELDRFYIGKKIYNQEIYNELVQKRNDINNLNYFPMYRG